MISGHDYDPLKSDIWSIGITLYYMTVGFLPFIDKDLRSLYGKIVAANILYPSSLSPDLVDLLKKMLTSDPKQRIDFEQILLHKWVLQQFPDAYKPFEDPLVSRQPVLRV